MNPVVLYFASGESLYAGALLVSLAVVLSPYLERVQWRHLRHLTAWLGLALMVMACPPFPWVAYVIFAAVFVVWLTANDRWFRWLGAGLSSWSSAALILTLLAMVLLELPHRRVPNIIGLPSDHLVVIGDSISSGIDLRVPAWPVVMEQLTNVPVKNLSRPGAQVAEGPDMVARVTADDGLVLIELGGNDLLGGVPSVAFEKGLDATLSKLAAPGRTLVMFELPLLPHKSNTDRFSDA